MTKFGRILSKIALYCIILIPFVQVAWGLHTNEFLDPVDEILKITGKAVLQLLIAGLIITPLVWVSGWKFLYVFRRMLGVSAFSYVLLHMIIWALGQELTLEYMVKDIVKHNYIIVGAVGLVLMCPLAVTSMDSAIKFMGIRKWQTLHKLTYAVAVFGVVHYILQEKSSKSVEPYIYLSIVLALLFVRFVKYFMSKKYNK